MEAPVVVKPDMTSKKLSENARMMPLRPSGRTAMKYRQNGIEAMKVRVIHPTVTMA
jgi:hypothetical protein